MPRLSPVTEAEATDKVAQTYARIRELLEVPSVPEPFLAYGRVPAFLQDFYMNFKKFVWSDGALDVKSKATVALAVSAINHCDTWIDYYHQRCRNLGLSEQYVADTLAVVAACVQYNIFFKFRDLSGSDIFSGMSVGLRAHTFANTSLDEKMVELLNVAISDINGCKPCTSGHVSRARELGVADEAILETVQCAATVASSCVYMNAAGL
jgi:alkyl hydroperoxide reductase subunit D